MQSSSLASWTERLNSWFRFREHATNLRTEILGGITTFVTMAYIIVVNPAILSGDKGLPTGPSTVATILTAVVGSLLMGFYANRPIAVAPYMGENAFIAFGLIGLQITWQQRLASVFLSGLAFLAITLLGVRTWLAASISHSLKLSFAVGIGLFLAFIGLYETGIVTSPVAGKPYQSLLLPDSELLRAPEVPVRLGDLRNPQVLLSVAGFVLMAVLLARGMRGAILLGMVVTGIAGYALGLGPTPRAVAALPFTGEYTLGPIAFQLDLAGVLRWSFVPLLLTLFLMSFLDTLGTLVGVGAAGGLLDKDGNLPNMERPMTVDALACMFAACVGTSTSGAYIESATGIREGARTGLAAIVTALLFALSLFFIPLAETLQQMRFAYGPALIIVGMLMLGSVVKIDFADLSETVPAFATIALMLFTYNIGNGLTAGLVLYPIVKVAVGKARQVNGGSVVLALVCAAYYVFGLPH